jgi:putative adhesin
MPRPRPIAAALLLLPLLAVPAHARPGARTWDREFQVARQPTVRIDAEDAKVTVRSWKESRVTVHVATRGQATGLFFGRRGPVVEIGQEGNEIRVRARFEGSESGILVISSTRLEVEVWLPTQSDLAVSSGDGAIRVEDVTGRIDLDARDGSVTGRALRGDLEIRAADGRVQLDDVDGSLRLAAHDGHSEVRGRFDRIDAESADGGIDAEALPGSRMGSGWSLRSSDGSIHLRIPHDLAATLDARTRDGGLSVDMPVRVQGRIGHHELFGDLNGGGPTLRLRSSDGSIRVEALD